MGGAYYYDIFDLLLVPFYLLIIYLVANNISKKNINKYPEYKYFKKGIYIKLIGVSLFLIFYTLYYPTGDTISYYEGSRSLARLLFQDFNKGLQILFNTDSIYNSINSFNYQTGRPPFYIFRDTKTFNVCRFSIVFYLLGSGSLIVSNLLCCTFSYVGIWKLYRLFNTLFPGKSRPFAYFILFMPSLVFWGGGIMKDSYVLGGICWATYCFYYGIIKREKIILNLIFLFVNFIIIINIKSYVAIAAIPGMLIWLNSEIIKSLKSSFARFLLRPIVFSLIILSGLGLFNNLDAIGLSQFENVDETIVQAQVIQQDLLREEQYGKNNYNIGQLDGTLSGLVSLAPTAIFTGIYRPTFLEIGSPAMILSAIENLILLLFSILAIASKGPIKFFKTLFNEPLLVYSLIFTLIFAFGVGIASTNFGALVRYRIPLIPFYFTLIYIVYKSK
jgi:hypothetical protein